jgi:hypothetical protein
MPPFDWNHLLRLARELQNAAVLPTVDRQAVLRTGVTRAYFGAFGIALDYAVANLQFDARYSAEDHGRLRAHFKSKRRQNVARFLDDMRGWRNQCDYDPHPDSDFEAMLRDAIADADEIIRALPPPQPRLR